MDLELVSVVFGFFLCEFWMSSRLQWEHISVQDL